MPDATIDAETTRLAMRAQGGDASAFCALVDLHQRTARRVALAALGSHAEADDAVQEACVTAWQRIGSLEDPAAFRAWLLRITWRKALDRRRSLTAWLKRLAFRHDAGPGGPHDHGAAEPLHEVATTEPLVDEELVRRERDQLVAQMIHSLPPRLRDPFLLAAAGEHRYEDIANLLAIPLGTVKWRVSEARRVLREKLIRVGVGREGGLVGSRNEQ
jgi:RNA polymerase sigma-70 factor (ECF subfamily)